ncbi:MAG: mycothiol synthase [Nocardioidaceae bacterium]
MIDTEGLTPHLQAQVVALAAAARVVDGVEALDDQVRLDLQRAVGGAAHHLVVTSPDGDHVVGYAHIDLRSDGVSTGHVVVHPQKRSQGIGTSLIAQASDLDAGRSHGFWAHGDLPAASRLATRVGLRRDRELRQMRLELRQTLSWPAYPADVVVRTFEPGRDDAAWVQLNAAAFRDHPEQGRLQLDDLHQRMAQPWFDPLGFFVVERGAELVGFHWTKVHRNATSGGAAVGEVYVLGVSPQAQGLGLGKALTLTGLHHLRELGVDAVILYVDADNAAAIAVYERLGFSVSAVDVVYAQAPGNS